MLCVVAFSCRQSELVYEHHNDGKPITLALSFRVPNSEIVTMGTRAINEDEIKDLNIYTIDSIGKIVQHRWVENYAGGEVKIIGITGKFKIAIIANTEESLGDFTSEDELLAAEFSSNGGLVDKSRLSYLSPMLYISSPAINEVVRLEPITLLRTYAKVTTMLDFTELSSSVTITPLKIALKQVPLSCTYLGANSPTDESQIATDGDFIDDPDDLNPTKHALATPLYLWENMQGTSAHTANEKDKTPIEGREKLCTFLEVTTLHKEGRFNNKVTYRYYLGKDITDNFDLERNNWYKATLKFTGNGGFDEVSWRVDIEPLKSDPISIYTPYGGYRTTHFDLPGNIVSCTELIPNNHYLTADGNRLYVTSNNTNTGNDLKIGSITLDNGDDYDIYQSGELNNSFMTDVGMLQFPWNNTFGQTNYTITQDIVLYDNGNLPSTWSARTTADWLYIGDGVEYTAFTAPGVTGKSGTNGMISNTGESLMSSEIQDGYLAVRCDENNSSESRRGFVLFYNENNKEIGRVCVEQGERIELKSPNRMEKFYGVYKMGNFSSDGSDGIYNSTTSRKDIYVKVSPFYLSVNETNMKQYCDFFNDLGYTNVTDKNSDPSGVLDKIGTAASMPTDYPGTFTTPQAYPPCELSIEIVNGRGWMMTPWKILKGNEYLTNKAHLSNYALCYIDYFQSADYNYWAQKFSGGRYSRTCENLLVTEAEWEAAARGIRNNYNSISDWENDYSGYRNGSYPYAMPYREWNSGLTGTNGDQNNKYVMQTVRFRNNSRNKFGSVSYRGISNSTTQNTFPVASLMASAEGLYDMSGNQEERTSDLGHWTSPIPFDENTLLVDPCNYTRINMPDYSFRICKGGYNNAKIDACINSIHGSYSDYDHPFHTVRIVLRPQK